MKKKELVIIDLVDNQDIKLLNQYYIKINNGDLIYNKNCKKIQLNLNNFFKNRKKNILNFFHKLHKSIDNINLDINSIEMEIFNLRHDKSNFIEKILYLENLSIIINSKKFQIKKIITDNEDFAKTIKINFKNIDVFIINKKSKEFSINLYLSVVKYFIKIFILSTFFKLTNFKKLYKKKDYNITLYPHFFNRNKCKIYKNNYVNLNFLLGDETQLGNSVKELIKKAHTINRLKGVMPIERNITYLNLMKIFINNVKQCYKFNNFFKKKIIYNKFIVSNILKKHLILSFLNRIKLSYYDEAIKKIINPQTTTKINYFMFEYSFGFYLSNLLRNISKGIKTTGYQHGIFTKKLMWLDILNNQNREVYLPDKIISNQFLSTKAYSKYINKKNIFLRKTLLNEVKNFKKIAYKKSSKVLVILGLHDFKDNMQSVINLSNNRKYKYCKFYLKFHPKLKGVIIKKMPNNVSIIQKIPKNSKYQILVSQSSSLLYMLLDSGIECRHLNYNNKINIL